MTTNTSIMDNPSVAGGVLKDCIDAIDSQSIVSQPRLALLAALQAVSITVGKAGGLCAGLMPQKAALYTMGIAPTTAGKDAGLSFTKRICSQRKVYQQSDVPSDKDLKLNFIRENGQYALIIDEMDSLIAKMGSKQSFESGIVAVLLEMYTSKCVSISNKYREEMVEKLKKDRDRIEKSGGNEKKKFGVSEGFDGPAARTLSEHGNSSLTEVSLAIQMIDAKIKLLEEGVQNPLLNVHGVATPKAVSVNLKSEHADRGFLGRFIIFNCPGYPEKDWDSLYNSIGAQKADKDQTIQSIEALSRVVTPNMIPVLDNDNPEVKSFFNKAVKMQENGLNSGKAVCGRIVENWFKIASLFAYSVMDTSAPCPKPVIDERCARWAFEVVEESVMSTMMITDGDNDDDEIEVSDKDKLYTKIIKMVTTDKAGVYVSKIVGNMVRGKKNKELALRVYPDDIDAKLCVERAIFEMCDAGIIEYVDGNINKIRRG